MLTMVIEEEWEPNVKQQWMENKKRLREALLHEFGVLDGDRKIDDFADMGSAPWSIIAQHNDLLSDVRAAFASGHYYSALLGAAGLGERILNELILRLRPYFADHPATRYVAGKKIH